MRFLLSFVLRNAAHRVGIHSWVTTPRFQKNELGSWQLTESRYCRLCEVD